MEIQGAYTLVELRAMAKEQGLAIEEKYGRYRVISQHTISDLSINWRVVEAGAGYSLTFNSLNSFLVFHGLKKEEPK